MALFKRQHKHNLENLNKELIKLKYRKGTEMTTNTDNKPKFKLLAKHVYGKTLYYPDCDKARAACSLAKKTTLDIKDIKLLMTMGFDYEVTSTPITIAI